MTQVCKKCHIEKPLTDYYIDKTTLIGRRGSCKACNLVSQQAWDRANPEKRKAIGRRAHLKEKYGITPEHWDQMLADQDGKCGICRTDNPGQRSWKVDHDHTTGAVRGLLCNHCNLLLGHAKDDIDVLLSAMAYLQTHQPSLGECTRLQRT